MTAFYFFRFCLPFLFAVVTAIYLFVFAKIHLPGMTRFAMVAAAFGAGFYAPNIYVSNIATKRRQNIVQAFPDALDLLLICVEAGMSIEAALQKVSQEIGSASIELAEEIVAAGGRAQLPARPAHRLRRTGQAP